MPPFATSTVRWTQTMRPNITLFTWPTAAVRQGTDGGVVKKLLREGAGWEQPEKGDKVQGASRLVSVACLAPTERKCCPPGACIHGAVSVYCLGLGADTRRRALQCTMSARWHLMAACLIRRGSGTSPSASRWGKVRAWPAEQRSVRFQGRLHEARSTLHAVCTRHILGSCHTCPAVRTT
jgi:hypothetical protein